MAWPLMVWIVVGIVLAPVAAVRVYNHTQQTASVKSQTVLPANAPAQLRYLLEWKQ